MLSAARQQIVDDGGLPAQGSMGSSNSRYLGK